MTIEYQWSTVADLADLVMRAEGEVNYLRRQVDSRAENAARLIAEKRQQGGGEPGDVATHAARAMRSCSAITVQLDELTDILRILKGHLRRAAEAVTDEQNRRSSQRRPTLNV